MTTVVISLKNQLLTHTKHVACIHYGVPCYMLWRLTAINREWHSKHIFISNEAITCVIFTKVMVSLGSKLCKLQMSLPDDGSWLAKHVGGNIIHIHAVYVQVVGFLIK
jgi:hypothetical protein